MPQPCIAPGSRVFRIKRSSVPWRRSDLLPIRTPVDDRQERTVHACRMSSKFDGTSGGTDCELTGCQQASRAEAHRPPVDRLVVVLDAEAREAGELHPGDGFRGHGHADAVEPPIVADDVDRAGPERRVLREAPFDAERSEEHTSELQSQSNLVCRLLLERKNEMRW